MGAKIFDEFSDLPISRQRKLHLRNVKKGLCHCGQEKATKTYCLKHAIWHRDAQRKRRGTTKKNNSLTRGLENDSQSKKKSKKEVKNNQKGVDKAKEVSEVI